MRDTAIKIVIGIGLVALASWYSCSVYSQCREAGGGALLCLHIMKAR